MNGIEQGAWVINKTFQEYLDPKYNSLAAKIQLGATGLQESKFIDRIQQPNGPAHSFWQMEKGGAIHGVLKPGSIVLHDVIALCAKCGVQPTEDAIYAAVINNDVLACGIARLAYYCDPNPLPRVGDVDGAWRYYITNWGPGKPKPLTWPGNYALAKGAFNE